MQTIVGGDKQKLVATFHLVCVYYFNRFFFVVLKNIILLFLDCFWHFIHVTFLFPFFFNC
jgi:hypothetical protein